MKVSTVRTVIKGNFMKYFVFILLLTIFGCNPFDKRTPEEKRLAEHMEKLDDDTLLGPDKNGDGVRDDIEYWINNSSEVKNNNVRRAALFYAKTLRDGLKYVNDKEKSIQNSYLKMKARDCLRNVINDWPRIVSKVSDPILKNMFNTEQRLKTQLQVDQHFAGQGGAIYRFAKEACSFELEPGNYK